MDLPVIQNVTSLVDERHKRSAFEHNKANKPEINQGVDQDQEKQAPPHPDQVHRRAKLLIDLSQEYKPFNRKEAYEALTGLARNISSESPWRLAEIQAVVDRTLIPSAYV